MVLKWPILLLFVPLLDCTTGQPHISATCPVGGQSKCSISLNIAENLVEPLDATNISQHLNNINGELTSLSTNITSLSSTIGSNESSDQAVIQKTLNQLQLTSVQQQLISTEVQIATSQLTSMENQMVSIMEAMNCLQDPTKCPLDQSLRVDCHPEPFNPTGPSQPEVCQSRGCYWDGSVSLGILGAPRCYYPADTGYTASSSSPDGMTLSLQKTGLACPYDQDIPSLQLQASYTPSGLRVKVYDPNNLRYEPPVNFPRSGPLYQGDPATQMNYPPPGNFTFKAVTTAAGTFGFQIVRQSNNLTIFDASLPGFLFANQFLQISAYLPTRNVYGFGENIHLQLKHNLSQFKTWPMFARDEPPNSCSSGCKDDRKNLYGVHPFYLVVEPNGNAHGVLILNSNAQEYTLGPGPRNQGMLTYRTIGGLLDFYFFPGPTADMVIQQYTAYIGLPGMPAYWALGFQLSRWGYGNLTVIQNVLDDTRNSGIPQDVQVFDIDYMDRYKDFTYDNVNFANITSFVQTQLHGQGRRLIVILDPAINVYSSGYPAFQDGFQQNVYVQWNNATYVQQCVNQSSPQYICPLNNAYSTTNGTNVMLGTVWPDQNVAFPDFFNSNTSAWWQGEIEKLRPVVPFDGLWIDMNEPANFATNNPNAW